jgi:hypothetical protein
MAAWTRVRGIVPAILLFLLAGGCVKPFYVLTGDKARYEGPGYSVELPSGWVRVNADNAVLLRLTRDGEALGKFVVRSVGVAPKDRIRPGMLPQEAAEVVIGILSGDRSAASFSLLENRPATLDGLPAFRLSIAWRDGDGGVARRGTWYGAISGDSYFEIYHLAAARYYFDRDASEFERLVSSFRIRAGR